MIIFYNHGATSITIDTHLQQVFSNSKLPVPFPHREQSEMYHSVLLSESENRIFKVLKRIYFLNLGKLS